MLATAIAFRTYRGRSADLAHLLERRREAGAGRTGLVLVSGDAGSGKTRLLTEFRAKLDASRMHVAVAQCREASNRPYSAIVDALARLQRRSPDLAPAPNRAEQFMRIQNQLRAISERRTVVLLVEDVHWATTDTLELLEAIVSDASSRLLVVATQRTGEPSEDSPAFNVLLRLHRLPHASHLILEPLPDSVIEELLADSGENATVQTKREIVRLCEGNPLFAEELLRASLARQTAAQRTGSVPIAVRALVQERFLELVPAEREIVANASVIGRRFSTQLLQAVSGAGLEETLRALRHARDLHLIVEEEPGLFAFAHALKREAIASTILETQACELHRRVALALEAVPEAERNVHELAYHWWAARDAEHAFSYGVAAGDAAMAVFAHEEAALAYSYALAHVDRKAARAAGPLMQIGMAYGRTGMKKQACAFFSEAAEAFRAAGDLRGECHAAIEHAAAKYGLGEEHPEASIISILPRLTDRTVRRRAQVALAQLHIMNGRFAEGASALDGVEIARCDDHVTAAIYYAMRGTLTSRDGDVTAYIDTMRHAARVAMDGGLVNEPAIILANLASGLTRMGYFEEGRAAFAESETLARERHLFQALKLLQLTTIMRAVFEGDFVQARALIEQGHRETAEMSDLSAFFAGWGLFVAQVLGDDGLLQRYFAPEISSVRQPAHLIAATAQRLRDLARDSQADALLDMALDRDEGARTFFTLYLECARSRNTALQGKARAQLAQLAEHPQDRVFRAVLALFDAIAAFRSGDRTTSSAHASHGARLFRELGFRLWEAQARELAGDVNGAAAIYREIGAISPLRGAAFGRNEPDTAGIAKRSAGQILSPRELEVAELVATGATNAAVAEKMAITVKAVEKHLSSIYGKLAISSRSQLAAHFRRQEHIY